MHILFQNLFNLGFQTLLYFFFSCFFSFFSNYRLVQHSTHDPAFGTLYSIFLYIYRIVLF